MNTHQVLSTQYMLPLDRDQGHILVVGKSLQAGYTMTSIPCWIGTSPDDIRGSHIETNVTYP